MREAKLPVSTVCQGALSQALRDLSAIGPHIDHEVELPADVEVDVPVVRHLAVAVRLAYDVAAAHGSATVETEDLLQGVLDEGESLILRTLDAIGVEGARIQAELDRLDRRRDPLVRGQSPRLSERARRAIGQAAAEASRRGQPLNLAHVLLALLDDGGGGAGRALEAAGLDASSARRAIAAMESGLAFGRTLGAGIAGVRAEGLLLDIVARLDRLEAQLGSQGGPSASTEKP